MQLLVLAALSLALFVVAVALGVVFGVGDGTTPGDEWSFLAWNTVSQVLIFAVPTLLVARLYYRGQQREYLRLDFGKVQWMAALCGVGILGVMIPLTDWLTTWNDSWHWSGAWEALEKELRRVGESSQYVTEQVLKNGSLPVNLFCVALIPALCEELFFRAGIQNLLQRWFGNVHAAVWVTAAIFSLAHGEVFAFLPRFLLGGLLGYFFAGGSLLASVAIHFFNNAMVVFFYWLALFDPSKPSEWPSIEVVMSVIGTLGFFGAAWLKLLKFSK